MNAEETIIELARRQEEAEAFAAELWTQPEYVYEYQVFKHMEEIETAVFEQAVADQRAEGMSEDDIVAYWEALAPLAPTH